MKVVFYLETDITGTDAVECVELHPGEDPEVVGWDLAMNNAEMYFDVYEVGLEPEDEEEWDDNWITTDQVGYHWEPYVEETHGPWPHKN
jgi:hypothetical protein